MKKIAILTAAGVGSRMGQDIPKQFLNVGNKPIIIYTMEAFQIHPEIDAIIVVCLDGWQEILSAYSKQFNITKLVSIVSGGKDGQASISNGLKEAKRLFDEKDMVLIHDGNRPLVSQDIISDSIVKCSLKGNAIAAIPCTEVILTSDDGNIANELLDRDKVKRTQTPHTFILKDILSAHEEAKSKNLSSTAASCSLYSLLGRKLYFSIGSEKNMKLTTKEDIEMFKALLTVKNSDWLK